MWPWRICARGKADALDGDINMERGRGGGYGLMTIAVGASTVTFLKERVIELEGVGSMITEAIGRETDSSIVVSATRLRITGPSVSHIGLAQNAYNHQMEVLHGSDERVQGTERLRGTFVAGVITCSYDRLSGSSISMRPLLQSFPYAPHAIRLWQRG
jgi:hypothetical protein